jgi:glycosyltransferase involved in cell wall biosynthesis
MRLAVITSHPVQYYAPLFRELARTIDLQVFFAHDATPEQQAAAGFGAAFRWDVDLLSGYAYSFLENVAADPDAGRFNGCDTPEIGARLREGKFDAVLALGWHLKSQLQGIYAAKRAGLPVMIRGDSQLGISRSRSKRFVKALAYPLLLRTFDAALYVGARNRAYYRHYGYPAKQLFASPHAVDTRWFADRAGPAVRARKRAELGLEERDHAVLFAGKLLPFKRPLDAVGAVAGLRRDGIAAHLLIAGSGELSAALHAEAMCHGFPVHDLGFLNQTGMPAAYAAADVLLLPSDGRETWGLVCNEALACGTPIVVSDEAGCAPDLCRDGVGIAYRGGDVNAATGALTMLLRAPPTPATIEEVSHRFSLQRAAAGIVDALTALRESR